ncbi:MAG: MBL fold metallo-hydrolase [Bacteroidales bacterium]|nr:MBL fold metallo-hydrolase [Bacteroidales bacterium]
MINIRYCVFNLFEERTYVAWGGTGACVIVDPGCGSAEEQAALDALLTREGLTPEAILLTHGHIDHILGVKALQDRFGIPVHMHPADTAALDFNARMAERFHIPLPESGFTWTPVQEGQVLEYAGLRFEVIATPGHTPGGVCYLEREQGVLFTGDTLFAGSIGRTDFPYSEYDDEIRSILEKLLPLEPDITILPGHGPVSTIGHERSHNPFLEPFNEPEEPADPELEPVVIRGLRT